MIRAPNRSRRLAAGPVSPTPPEYSSLFPALPTDPRVMRKGDVGQQGPAADLSPPALPRDKTPEPPEHHNEGQREWFSAQAHMPEFESQPYCLLTLWAHPLNISELSSSL